MLYDGIFCRLEFNESNFSYTFNKRVSPAFFWGKFNSRLEIPISAIVNMQVRTYMPYGKGLVLKIKSGYKYEKTKTLAPINITGVPQPVIDKLQSFLHKGATGAQENSMAS
jgi:hypothetical protein